MENIWGKLYAYQHVLEKHKVQLPLQLRCCPSFDAVMPLVTAIVDGGDALEKAVAARLRQDFGRWAMQAIDGGQS